MPGAKSPGANMPGANICPAPDMSQCWDPVSALCSKSSFAIAAMHRWEAHTHSILKTAASICVPRAAAGVRTQKQARSTAAT